MATFSTKISFQFKLDVKSKELNNIQNSRIGDKNMINNKYTWEKLAIQVPKIMLPAKNIDKKNWAVIACDQYTSNKSYWNNLAQQIGSSPSTLKLIYPEAFLNSPDKKSRIQEINRTMKTYLNNGILEEHKPGFIYVERLIKPGVTRKGLITSVDLEQFDYNKGSKSLIRPTEGTVLNRIPPRLQVRENASVETPHVMLLIDDPSKTIIEGLAQEVSNQDKVYDFDINMSGQHLVGYRLDDDNRIFKVKKALEKLADPQTFREKYSVPASEPQLLYAVGDGNHSLATAKAHWENVKKTLSVEERKNHPARFALVEIVNLHDDSLVFEPIHRVVFKANITSLLDKIKSELSKNGAVVNIDSIDPSQINSAIEQGKRERNGFYIPFIAGNQAGIIRIINSSEKLAVGALQKAIDAYLSTDSSAEVDYIHGDSEVKEHSQKDGNIGFFLPAMQKSDLFKSVIENGALPRKTFSMGEAEEKRFYMECKKII